MATPQHAAEHQPQHAGSGEARPGAYHGKHRAPEPVPHVRSSTEQAAYIQAIREGK